MNPRLLTVALLVTACADSTPEKVDPIDSGVPDTDTGTDTDTCPVYFADTDGDGYGDPALSIESCDTPAGYVSDDTDCDDTTAAAAPDAPEVCDGIDNDCDTLIDDEDDDTSTDGMTAWHADVDADGFGDATSLLSCEQPSGTVADDTDCDDTDATTNPDAVEVCGDGQDNDCDAGDEACTLPENLDDAVVQWVGGGDGFGAALAGADLTGDGVGDLLVGAYIYGSDYEGAAYIAAGPLSGTMDIKDATGMIIGGEIEGAFGYTVSVTEDADNDGVADILIGALGLGGSSARTPGHAYLITDVPTGTLQMPDDAHAVFEGAAIGSNAGHGADDIGDLNGDGEVDFAIGAPQAIIGQGGHLSLFYGPVSGSYTLRQDEDVLLYCITYCSTLGDTINHGDLTGDGIDDLVVPVNTTSYSGFVDGMVAILTDPSSSLVTIDTDADAYVRGSSWSSFGQIAAIGDWNGDGYEDLLSSDGTSPGTTYLMEGPFSGESAVTDAVATFVGRGTHLLEGAGMALAEIDLDHNGEDDLAIGAAEVDYVSTGPGSVYVFLGPVTSGAYSVADADVILTGPAKSGNSNLGITLANVGDTTGDGHDELAAVSTYYDGGMGSVWLFE